MISYKSSLTRKTLFTIKTSCPLQSPLSLWKALTCPHHKLLALVVTLFLFSWCPWISVTACLEILEPVWCRELNQVRPGWDCEIIQWPYSFHQAPQQTIIPLNSCSPWGSWQDLGLFHFSLADMCLHRLWLHCFGRTCPRRRLCGFPHLVVVQYSFPLRGESNVHAEGKLRQRKVLG